MASEADKEDAQHLVDEVASLYNSESSPQEKEAWAETALSKMDEAAKLNSKNTKVCFWQGFAKNELGDYKSAIKYLTKAIDLDKKNYLAWESRAFAKIELEEYKSAISDCTEAINIKPRNANAWSRRGFAKFRLKNYKDAIKDFDKALSLDQNNEATKQSRQSAIDDEKEEATRKKVEEYHKRLTTKSKEFHTNYEGNIHYRKCLFATVVIVIIAYISYLWLGNIFSEITKNKNPFALLPYIVLLFAILSPFVWLIRINTREAERNLALREDYDGRHTVELYLLRFFASTDRREFAQKYITYWMYNNPSETLIRLANKSAEKSELPQAMDIGDIAKNVQPPPTDPKP